VSGIKPSRQKVSLLVIECRDDLFCVDVILGPHILTLEHQLQIRGQVRDAVGCAEHGRLPPNLDSRVPPVDPVLRRSLTDRNVQ
jgi:hypothetical protein